MVAVRSRFLASDEELGKRNDDYSSKGKMSTPRKALHRPFWASKRLLGLIAACFCVWLFIHYMPTDLGPQDASRRPRYNRNAPAQQRPARGARPDFKYTQELVRNAAPEAPVLPRQQPQQQASTGYSYDGPVKFFALASSLNAVQEIADIIPGNHHVVFAASDLNSLSALMPIACEMANWRRNHVHVAVMGRDEMSIEDIQNINGAAFKDCPVYFHDARPDQASISTGPRMQLSVSGALGHINTYMEPRALITVDDQHENTYFSVGTTRTAKVLGITHITIPKDAPQKLSWLARLDANSLSSWYSASFDVLIQAPLNSAGSLIRLLDSLEKADYTGFTPPRLTVELPHDIGLATQNYLTTFKWPPFGTQGFGQTDQLLIRRRISEQHIPVEESSRRFVESFYPSSPRGPHVLILSPQVELSPAYFHYLKLHLLEFRHSYDRPNLYKNLLGISLETPSFHLNASGEFVIPRAWENSEHDPNEDPPMFEPFLWEAPNSNAALYFSDKWIELHSFLTRRRTAALHPKTEDHHAKRPARISHIYPAWLEYTLDLMRLRGYYLHYPGVFNRRSASESRSRSSFSSAEESLVIVHNELFQPPEEFLHPISPRGEKSMKPPPRLSSDSVLEANADYLSSHHPAEGVSRTLHDERPLVRQLEPILPALALITYNDPLDPTRPANKPLPPLDRLALLDSTGEEIDLTELAESSLLLRRGYRHFAGGCTQAQSQIETKRELGSAADLFCLDTDDTVDATMLQPEAEHFAAENRRDVPITPPARKVPPKEAAAAAGKVDSEKKPTRIPGSGGVAANIARVKDAAQYEATAKAGLLKKLAEKEKNYEYPPTLNHESLKLTDEEKQYITDQEKRKGANGAGARLATSQDDDDDGSVARDTPPVPADVKPGQNFEEQMAQRDAAKKGSLSDRARGTKGRARVADDSEEEFLASERLVLTAEDEEGLLDADDGHGAGPVEHEEDFEEDQPEPEPVRRRGAGAVRERKGRRDDPVPRRKGQMWTDEDGVEWEIGDTTVSGDEPTFESDEG